MEYNSMASAIREIPFRLMSIEQGYEETPFMEGIYASLIGQLFLGFNCEANFNTIATLIHAHERLKVLNGVNRYLQQNPMLALEIWSYINRSLYFPERAENFKHYADIVDYCLETSFSIENLFRMFLEEAGGSCD